MREIPLTRGQAALVDDEDFEWLSQWRWQAMLTTGLFYASRDVRVGPRREGKKWRILMHRAIIEAPAHLQVDHRDRNTLNNTRTNIRLATSTQNLANRIKPRPGTSKFKGVFWDSQFNKWHATITVDGRRHFLGRYDEERLAAEAYNRAAMRLFGEFARPNQMEAP